MMKHVTMIIMALLFNSLSGAAFASILGVAPIAGAIGMNAVGMLVGYTPDTASILRAGVLKEVWTGELVKALRAGLEGSWLDGIPDQSSIVENDVIHLVDVGVDPEVLVNNTTYPIEIQELDDKDIAIKLDKFQTKVTPITDDELYAISYDKMQRVKESHSNSINDAKSEDCMDLTSMSMPITQSTRLPVQKKHWQQSRKLGNSNVLLLSIQSVYSRLPGAPACILVKLLLIRNTSVI